MAITLYVYYNKSMILNIWQITQNCDGMNNDSHLHKTGKQINTFMGTLFTQLIFLKQRLRQKVLKRYVCDTYIYRSVL